MGVGIAYSKSGLTKLATILIVVILCMGANGIIFFASRPTFVVYALPAIADISLTMTPSKTSVVPGTPVSYLYNVSNIGEVPLTGNITDDTFGAVGTFVNLQPGGWVGYNVTHIITQNTTNTATAYGFDQYTNLATDVDSAFVQVHSGVNISLTMTPSKTSVVPGTPVSYLYNVSNIGEVPLTGNITDDTFGAVGTFVNLQPGGWVGYNVTHIITQNTTNTATAYGFDQYTNLATDVDSAFVQVHSGVNISLTMTPSKTSVVPGTPVSYLYNVSNIGEVPLTGNITDDTFGAVGTFVNLQPGGWVGYNVTHIITQNTTNTATAYGFDQYTNLATDVDSAFVQVHSGVNISLTMTPSKTSVVPGTPVSYLYNVSNIGEVPLTGNITDDTFGAVGTFVNLQPGGWVGYNVTHIITQNTTNTATAYGFDQYTNLATDVDSAFVQVHSGVNISLTMTPSKTSVVPGTPVSYLYNVSNIGEVPLTGNITDDTFGAVGTFVNLQPGGWVGYNVTHIITQNTTNTATAYGFDQYTNLATDVDSAFVQVHSGVNISLTMTPSKTKVLSGSSITYFYEVTNTGNSALTGSVIDDKLGLVGTFTDLQPEEKICFTLTCVLKASTYNVAIATATDPFGQEVKDTACCFVKVYWPSPSPVITVNSPNGGERWIQGSSYNIKWSSTGSVGSYVRIELLKRGIVNRVLASSTPNDGYYRWTIPSSLTPGNDYKIRITSTSKTVSDSSDCDFAITCKTAGTLTVTSPNCKESWRHGTTHAITWSKSGSTGSYVKIELLKDGVVNRIITSRTLNDGYYRWYIPSSLTPGNDYKIRITSIANPWIKDSSNNNFIIVT